MRTSLSSAGFAMAAYLRALGVPAERIIVDPWARHSTTNVRNASRLLLELDIPGRCW